MFLGLAAVVVTFLIVLNVIMQYFFAEIAYRENLGNLEGAIRAYERFEEQRAELWLGKALRHGPGAPSEGDLAIPGVDSETAYHAGVALRAIAEAPLILLKNAERELLGSDLSAEGTERLSLLAFPGINDALLGNDDLYGAWLFRQDPYRIAISPSIVGGQVAGLVAIGQRLDSAEELASVRQVTGTGAILSFGDRFFPANSPGNNDDKEFAAALSTLPAAADRERRGQT